MTNGAALALELVGVVKRFGDTLALDGASIAVRTGTVHALLGENGAGKSTLMRVAFGMVRPDAGVVRLDGAERRIASPREAITAGLGMVHQHFALVPAMTVAENVALGGGRGRFDARAAADRVGDIGRRTGLALDPEALVSSLGVGAQQRLEVVKALARDARTLILDEPTAVLAPTEADELLRWARAFANGGGSVVLITHKLHEVLTAADDVTVLRRGATVWAGATAGADEALFARAMLGDGGGPPDSQHGADDGGTGNQFPAYPTADMRPAPALPNDSVASSPVVLALRDASAIDERGVVRLRDASCVVRAGEIVGVAGVEGSGQRELLRLLAGRQAPATGRVERPGVVGFVPEDRHRDAMVLDFSLVDNVALRGAGRRRGRVRWRALAEHTRELIARYDVRAAGIDDRAGALSGGNQQKLVLARELDADFARGANDGAFQALVVESPTRGLDIRASAAVHARLREARDAGAAIVLYSSDLDEVLALADRVLACYAGTLREVPADREAVGRAILGVG
ncbi:MAG TPA: ATP-binding cassette domain-containing protein [Gemmatimonadaceae bacterium]|nr:ATP-binding cassette domain-containing protein [Gemmatimonadaceae bacterium]